MLSKNKSASLVAAVVGAFVLALTQPLVATAAPKATINNKTLNVSSGSYKVFASATQTFVGSGALTTPVTNGTPKNFFINNGGTLGVSRFIMTITLPNSSNVANGGFRRCAVNVSFTGTNTCATGSPIPVTNPVSNASTTYVIDLPASGYYAFQLVQNKTGNITVTTSISPSYYVSGVTNS